MAMKKLKMWLRGLIGGMIGGGSNAVIAFLGLAGANAAGVDVKAMDYKQAGAVFLSGIFISMFLYLKQSPLPPPEEDTAFITKDPPAPTP